MHVFLMQMKGLPEFPADQQGAGDVLSHLTASLDIGKRKVLSLACTVCYKNFGKSTRIDSHNCFRKPEKC
jgi:hypothetical protein